MRETLRRIAEANGADDRDVRMGIEKPQDASSFTSARSKVTFALLSQASKRMVGSKRAFWTRNVTARLSRRRLRGNVERVVRSSSSDLSSLRLTFGSAAAARLFGKNDVGTGRTGGLRLQYPHRASGQGGLNDAQHRRHYP
jgi:hypothetical protein